MKSHEVLDGGEGEKIERDVGRRIKVDRDEQKKMIRALKSMSSHVNDTRCFHDKCFFMKRR